MRLHRPLPLLHLDKGVGTGLARLSGLEGLTRSLLVATVPLLALDRLGSKDAVSQAFTVGAVLTLLVTLNLGRMEELVARKWVMTFGIVALFSAAILFTLTYTPAFVVAIGLRSAAASTFSVLLTLYVMDHIGKGELTQMESSRMVYNGLGWLIGPLLGVWLISEVGEAAPFIVSACLSILLMAYYWWLRLGNSVVIVAARRGAPSPLRSIPRFFKQRYMRIAYAITFTRATFWVALFVYGPIYIVEAGLDDWVAGAFLSGVAAILLFSPLIRRVADAAGIRRVVIVSLCVIAANLIAIASLGDARPLGIVFWVGAALGGAAIDVVGNIPFMRTVKPRERVAMATVFSTWREMSALVSPLIGALVLAVSLPFQIYYLVIASMCTITALFATRLPRRI
jgi:MFS family permease